MDGLIAATAIVHDLTIATGNDEDFEGFGMATGTIDLRHCDSLKQNVGMGLALVQPLFIQDSRRISVGPARILGHLLSKDYPLFHDPQRHANRLVHRALLFTREGFGGVGVADLAPEPQWRAWFDL